MVRLACRQAAAGADDMKGDDSVRRAPVEARSEAVWLRAPSGRERSILSGGLGRVEGDAWAIGVMRYRVWEL